MSVLMIGPLCSTLDDPTLLRGTNTATLLERCGFRLAKTAGGIGLEGTEQDNDYARSKVVSCIDIFLSHSWQASPRLKYLSFLLYFNCRAALVATIAGSMLLSEALAVKGNPKRLRRQNQFEDLTQFYNLATWGQWVAVEEGGFRLLTAGLCILAATLLLWHHFASASGCCRHMVFLDKVCIHQTDPVVKEQGIKALGAILRHSRKMLVVWDPSYFERLWCTFELSAFRHAHSSGKVEVLPLQVAGVTLGAFVADLLSVVIGKLIVQVDQFFGRGYQYGFLPQWAGYSAFLSHVALAYWMRKYLIEFVGFDDQLREFSIKRAKCLCCQVNHRLAGKELLCDRKLIESSIASWYGEGEVEAGLAKFDQIIRTEFRVDMLHTLGQHSYAPYSMVLLTGLPTFVSLLSTTFIDVESWRVVWYNLERLLLRQPICWVLYVRILSIGLRLTSQRVQSILPWALGLLGAAAWLVYSIMADNVLMYNLFSCIAWTSLEILVVLWIYCTSYGRSRRRIDEQAAEIQVEIPETVI